MQLRMDSTRITVGASYNASLPLRHDSRSCLTQTNLSGRAPPCGAVASLICTHSRVTDGQGCHSVISRYSYNAPKQKINISAKETISNGMSRTINTTVDLRHASAERETNTHQYRRCLIKRKFKTGQLVKSL